MYVRGVFICLFIYSFCLLVSLECISKSERISVYNGNQTSIRISAVAKVITDKLGKPLKDLNVKRETKAGWETRL